LVGHREAQAFDLTQHTSFYTRVAEARASYRSAAHRTARLDVPGDGDGALQIGVARGGPLVTGAEGAHARVNDAPNPTRRQAHARLGCVGALHPAFTALTAARARAVTRAPEAAAADTATTRATGTGAEAAAFAGAPTRVERARAEGDTAFFGAATGATGAPQPGARPAPEHDLVGAQPAQRICHRADRTERLRDLFPDVAREHFGHTTEASFGIALQLGLLGDTLLAERAFGAF